MVHRNCWHENSPDRWQLPCHRHSHLCRRHQDGWPQLLARKERIHRLHLPPPSQRKLPGPVTAAVSSSFTFMSSSSGWFTATVAVKGMHAQTSSTPTSTEKTPRTDNNCRVIVIPVYVVVIRMVHRNCWPERNACTDFVHPHLHRENSGCHVIVIPFHVVVIRMVCWPLPSHQAQARGCSFNSLALSSLLSGVQASSAG